MECGEYVWPYSFSFSRPQGRSSFYIKMAIGLGSKLKTASLVEIMATRARSTFPYRINFQEVGYTNYHDMKDWCTNNCKGLWRSHHTHALYFQFQEEQDALMFMLKWGGAHGNKLK